MHRASVLHAWCIRVARNRFNSELCGVCTGIRKKFLLAIVAAEVILAPIPLNNRSRGCRADSHPADWVDRLRSFFMLCVLDLFVMVHFNSSCQWGDRRSVARREPLANMPWVLQ